MAGAILAELSGPLAQLVEQGTLNPKVAGSNPARPIATPAATPTPHHHRGHRARRRHRGTNGAPPGAPPSGRDPASPEDWQGLVRPVDAGFPCATASPLLTTPAPPGRGLGRAYKAALGNATKSCAFPCGLANAGGSGGQGAGRRRLTAEAGRQDAAAEPWRRPRGRAEVAARPAPAAAAYAATTTSTTTSTVDAELLDRPRSHVPTKVQRIGSQALSELRRMAWKRSRSKR